MCVTRRPPDAGQLIAPEREMHSEQHQGTYLLSSQSVCRLLVPCSSDSLSIGAAVLGCSRSVWPGRCQICRLLIWRRASLLLSAAGLVAECAEPLRRWSCTEATGLVHPTAPTFVCTMHAGDQAGAR